MACGVFMSIYIPPDVKHLKQVLVVWEHMYHVKGRLPPITYQKVQR